MILDDIEAYKQKLKLSEKAENTINQYEGYLLEFVNWANIQCKEDITKEKLIEYKKYMTEKYKPSTVNIKITILNSFMKYLRLNDEYKLTQLKIQQKLTIENILTPIDYERLLRIADKRGKIKIKYIMMTLAETRN